QGVQQQGCDQGAEVQPAEAGNHLVEGGQHRVGEFDQGLRHRIVEVGARRLQQEARQNGEQEYTAERADEQEKDLSQGTLHISPSCCGCAVDQLPAASSRERAAAFSSARRTVSLKPSSANCRSAAS